MNSAYTLAIEDDFYATFVNIKQLLDPNPILGKADLIFINTGKDLVLIEDTASYGTVAISDRQKIVNFLRSLKNKDKPASVLFDLQLYYPYAPNLQTDSALASELIRNGAIVPIIEAQGPLPQPYKHVNMGLTGYTTYGEMINKFEISSPSSPPSIPLKLAQNKSGLQISWFGPFLISNNRLCLNRVWINYFIKQSDLPKTQYYNLGEILLDLTANPERVSFFKGKDLIIGDFDHDIHATPLGNTSGSLILANIYLTILNQHQQISYIWLASMLVLLSILSYFSWFSSLPTINLPLRAIIKLPLERFLSKYCSYLGVLVIANLLSVLVFDVFMSLLLPSVLLTCINFVSQKKYQSDEE